MRKVAGLLLLFVIVMPGPGQTTAALQQTQPDYYPLKVGTKWHYRTSGVAGQKGQLINQIAKIEKIDGQSLARLETTAQGNVVATEHLSSSAQGVFRHRFNDAEISPPICLLKYPVKKGDSWESETKIGGQKTKVTCRAGNEEVEVPAGKYKAVTVLIEADLGGPKLSTTYWFVERIGVVKQTAEVAGTKIMLELEKFEEGK